MFLWEIHGLPPRKVTNEKKVQAWTLELNLLFGGVLFTVAVPLCLNCTICDSLSSSYLRVINHLTVNKTNKLVITYRV